MSCVILKWIRNTGHVAAVAAVAATVAATVAAAFVAVAATVAAAVATEHIVQCRHVRLNIRA